MMKKQFHALRSGAHLQWLLATLLVLASVPVAYAQSPGQEAAVVCRLLDYIAVDYASAVQGGKVISPAVYAEMQEFSDTASEKIAALPANAQKTSSGKNTGRSPDLVKPMTPQP